MRSSASGTDGHVTPVKPIVDVRRARPLGQQASGAARLGVGVGIRRPARDEQQGQAGGAGRVHVALRDRQQLGHDTERRAEHQLHGRMAGAAFEHDGGHVALAVAGGEQHERLHGDPVAAAVHQAVEHGPGRRIGQLEEPEVDVQVRTRRRPRPRRVRALRRHPQGRSSRGPRAAARP